MIARLARALLLTVPAAAAAAPIIPVEQGSGIRYLANGADPGLGDGWAAEAFDDSGWATGVYGIGYEDGSGAEALIATQIPVGSLSVFTRAAFQVADPAAVTAMVIGADHDDAWAAWVNGVEVYRSTSLPETGVLGWDPGVDSAHESSNSGAPNYNPYHDITAAALPVLRAGTNLLAVAVYNDGGGSSDLVLVPQLVLNPVTSPSGLERGPYLQLATPTSLFVRWRTTTAMNSTVLYGPDPASLGFTAHDPAPVTEHVVPLAGLTAGDTYYYLIGSSSGPLTGGDRDHRFVMPPELATPKPSRIWVIGDSGTANDNARDVRDAYLATTGCRPTDLWLMLGDNAYGSGTDVQYQEAVFDMYPALLRSSVLWPTLGNHDASSAESATESGPYYDIFSLPRAAEAGGVASGTEAYYSFDFANIHFICLDSQETDRSVGGAMYTWLEADLSATTQDWIVAFFHHPPYTKGSHDSDTESRHIDIRENFLPLLESHGVDLVLSGHSHSYERSYFLDGHYGLSTTFGPSHQVDAGDGRLAGSGPYRKASVGPLANAGAVYTVAGSSGRTSGGSLDHPAMLVALEVLGSLVLEVSGGRLDATFLDDQGVTRDDFTVVKGVAVPPVSPAGLTANPVAGPAIDLTWQDRDGLETGFVVERSTDGVTFADLAPVTGNTTTYRDAAVVPGVVYWYRIRGENPDGSSLPSACASTTIVCAAPQTPAPSAPPVCLGQPSELRCGQLEPGVTYDWDLEDDGTYDATGCDVTHAYGAAGQYTARVRATGTNGCSVTSTVVVVVGRDVAPGEVGPVHMVKALPQGVRATWGAATDAATYRVARGDLGSFYSHTVDDTLGIGQCNDALTVFDDPDDLPGPTSYYYLVAGRGACGQLGSWGAPPPAPSTSCP